MSILGAVYYDRFADAHTAPGWFRAERYDFCEDAGEICMRASSKLLQKFSALFAK